MATCNFKIGDMVERITYDNSWTDGRVLKVGTICEVVDIRKFGNYVNIDVKVGNKRYPDNNAEYFKLVKSATKYKIGDRVIIEETNIEYAAPLRGKNIVGTIVSIDENRTHPYFIKSDYNKYGLYCKVKCLASELYNEKIVITHDGKTTTATMYCYDGTKKVATARCAPEDTFDFNFGAKLTMERLMEKVAPVEKDKYAVGDRIFAEDNINCHPGGAWGTVVEVLDKRIHAEDYAVKFDDGKSVLCSHVVPVPTTPEPPKYYNGKVVCIKTGYNWWTVGKVYEVKDGIITADDGYHYPDNGTHYHDAEDVRHAGNSEFTTGDARHNPTNEFIPLVE